jgi:hypothetical protein
MIVLRENFASFINHNLSRLSEKPSIRVLKEKFDTLHFSMFFPRNLPYAEKILDKTNQMIEGGHVEKIRQEMFLVDELAKKKEMVQPQVLTLGTLGLGFCIFMVACCLSLVAFFIEHLVDYLKTPASNVNR